MNQDGDKEKKINIFMSLSSTKKGFLIVGIILLMLFFAGMGAVTGKQILANFPTATAVPTLTPTVDYYSQYLDEVSQYIDIWSYYDPMDIMFRQVENNTMLTFDLNWQAEVLSHMKYMTERVCHVKSLTPPPSLEDYHQNLLHACDELIAGQPNLKTAFDYLNSPATDIDTWMIFMGKFHQHFLNSTVYIHEANLMDLSQ